ncbi:uncharacterized protein FFB20_12727 [Fusarium fujikuroi]|uniref:Inner kinetochore subunit AME1 domain-containing protein n=2 Tax=Fusarium fujikuroi TaxID=5127 RepID=S0DRP6_GIBF5|nr:uncharacterized protein FFUJ_03916 [Fusarium fujikuroi IMI 58289]CCT65121.1 uncharacterized protein FFUJ_03916 [Fusarium fujikuroi IMI 58289]SCN89685.1 uncharacterized protein FFM5_04764 [Fusarium fujikuroi]SCO06955.1 uncharacterized protein FFB20_12727 [Fusarium fujikuroi]VTT55299.1 unnamed protein product [Fusarium fujikuroi]
MATGQQRRADRLNERLRGAQRANIEDDSFNLDIAGLNIAGSTPAAPAPAPPTSSERRTPNTSAKRRRLDNEPPPSAQAQGSARRRSPRSRDPYDLPETSKESGAQDTTGESREEEERIPDAVEEPNVEPEEEEVEPKLQPESELPSPEVEAPDENDADVELPVLPDNEPSEQAAQRRASRRSLEQIAQDVANKRQDVRMSEAISSTTRLHTTLQEDDAPPSSSPLVRKVRRSEGPAVIRSRLSQRRPSRLAEQDEEDELSPNRADHAPADDERSDDATEDAEPEVEEGEEEPVVEEEPQEEEEAAEAIDAVEAAKTIGRKRPRRSLPSQSPVAEPDEQAEEEEVQEPAAKRRRGRPSRSPATQKQPAAKPKPTKSKSRTTQEKPLPKQVRRTKQAAKERRVSDGSAIEVTVQRFVNVKKFINGDDDEEEDQLAADLPFTTTGVTAVDVFAQACLEVIDSTVAKLLEALQNTEEKDKKKECRIKIRALEAYKEELTSRLLQLSIHLMDWQSLRKRVRLVQREKLSLREEILRLKAEREQVALKMDAVRIKHEEDTKESKYRLDTSAIMHDIDMAVERGRDAPELSRAQEKKADLANLELLVARITDEASSSSSAGGMLQQVKNFNAFLERAAIALETR